MPTTRRSRDTNGHTPTTNDTMRRVEAISVGAVNVLTGTVVSALRGMQEIGTEVGTTAVSAVRGSIRAAGVIRSEEHASELQSHSELVCRLLLEKQKLSA